MPPFQSQSSQPRHTELSILESYLLPPSPLPTFLPYTAFLQLVPTQHRSHPHLKRLYRDLQFQRNVDIDLVRQNIEREVSRSATLKAQLASQIARERQRTSDHEKDSKGANAKKRKRRTGEESDDELTNPADVAIDTMYLTASLHPAHTDPSLPTSINHPLTTATRKYHTRTSLLSSLDSACTTLETEIAELETESETLLAEINEIVGSLSDLRYGRFTRPFSGGAGASGEDGTMEDEVLDALRGLQKRIEEVVTS